MKKITFLVLLMVITALSLIVAPSVRATIDDKTYTEPRHTQKAGLPELYHDEGKTVRKGRISIVVTPNTVPFDVYVAYGVVPKTSLIHLGRYWQVSPIYDIWFKSQHNDAKVLEPEKSSIISIPYQYSDLEVIPGISFNENTLKIVYSNDQGNSWTMLRGSTVDTENKTVSAITDIGGGFMLMSGFVEPTQYVNYQKVRGAYVTNPDMQKRIIEDEIADTPFYVRIRYTLYDAALRLLSGIQGIFQK